MSIAFLDGDAKTVTRRVPVPERHPVAFSRLWSAFDEKPKTCQPINDVKDSTLPRIATVGVPSTTLLSARYRGSLHFSIALKKCALVDAEWTCIAIDSATSHFLRRRPVNRPAYKPSAGFQRKLPYAFEAIST